MIKKTIKLLLIALIAFSVLPEGVWAESIEKTLKTDVIVSFGTDKSYDNGGQDVSLRLVYKAWLKSDPTIEITESIVFNHLDVINGTSKPLPIKVVGPDKVVYTGEFKFTYSYDSKTGSLKVNNKDTALNSKALVTALAYPEAWIKPGVVGIEMNPLPFSYVKAISSPNVNYVKEFNDRINGGITNLITLESSRYGTNLQTNTKLAIYINQWQRKPDGTYDKSKEAQTVQVIFTAADFLNGKASGNGWDGVQYFRQMRDITTSSIIDKVIVHLVDSGKTKTEYSVQDFIREDTVWGHAGTDGAWSPIYVGTCTPTSTKRCQTWTEFISYRMRCASTSGATQDYWNPYNMSVHQSVGDSFCRSKSSTFTRFHSLQETKKVWSTASSMTNYAFNRRGYKVQNSWKIKVYGPAYWTDMLPDATQNYLGFRTVRIMKEVPFNYIDIVTSGNIISTAGMLLESDVNARVAAFAQGETASLVLQGNGDKSQWLKSDYTVVSQHVSNQATSRANTLFKEGNYWGLYLYQTGHWRAVEVPVQWYSIGGMMESPVTLTGTELKPDPEPETEPKDTSISLIDFTYVQAVYNSLRASYPVAAAQTMLIEAIKTDKNIAAQKAYQYYAGLLEKGETHLGALKTMSRALNIDLFK